MISITPMKQIRRKCLDCSCNSSKEVELCPVINCPLYLYRFGRRYTDADRKAQMEAIQESKQADVL
jgi:hypothetical protein